MEEEVMDSNLAYEIFLEELRKNNNVFEQEGIIITSADVIEDTKVLEVGLLEVTPHIEKKFRKLLKNKLFHKALVESI